MKEHGQSTDNRTEWSESTKNTRCSFHCHCLILGEVTRPRRFELPAFWFVVEKSGNPKALQVSHLQAAPASKILPQLVHNLVHKDAQPKIDASEVGSENSELLITEPTRVKMAL